MAIVKKKSVIPYYLSALVWLLAALIAPSFSYVSLAVIAVISVAVFLIGRRVIPDREIVIPDPPVSTGDEELDALIAQKDEAVAALDRLARDISNHTLQTQIKNLEQLTERIVQEVIKRPAKKAQIRRFMEYYLPTTLKILGTYRDIGALSGENIDATKRKIEDMMQTINTAFERQLDALFQDVSVDIAADIQVMEQLIEQEGLRDYHPLGGN